MSITVDIERLELQLLVSGQEGEPHAVELSAPADAPLGEVADALAASIGAVEGEELVAERLGGLRREQPLADAQLRHGDHIVLGRAPAGEERATTERELVVVGGPASGRRFPLPIGEHVIGRDAGAAIRLDDPALSGKHLRVAVQPDGVTVEDLGSRNGSTVEGASLEAGRPRPLEPETVVRAGRTLLALEAPLPPAAGASRADGTIPFNRPPRVHRPPEQAVRPLAAPPAMAVSTFLEDRRARTLARCRGRFAPRPEWESEFAPTLRRLEAALQRASQEIGRRHQALTQAGS